MLGKASEIKTKVVEAHYEYPDGNYSLNKLWVPLDGALNEFLGELGEAQIIDIKFVSQAHGDGELLETALIIYKEAPHE